MRSTFGALHSTVSALAIRSPNNYKFTSHLYNRATWNSKTTGESSTNSTNTGINLSDPPAKGISKHLIILVAQSLPKSTESILEPREQSENSTMVPLW